MTYFKLITFSLLVVIGSCTKQEQKPGNIDTQSSTQNVTGDLQNIKPDIKKWVGHYTFEESAPSVTGAGSQSWVYDINVTAKEDTTLTANIQVDGFQTMTRIESDVIANEKSADFIFSKYGKDNLFELYKKGEKLFSLELNDKNEIITNWAKMKAYVIDNQKNGKVRFKKVIS